MPDSQIPLLPSRSYHIFNHVVGWNNFFEKEADYLYFLSNIKFYVLPVAELLCYCLMPLRFHFVVRIRNKTEIEDFLLNKIGEEKYNHFVKTKSNFVREQISQQFANLFNSYAKHYNYSNKRIGSLFKRCFRRIEIDNEDHLRNLICNVHQSPVDAGLVNRMDLWKYGSYPAVFSLKSSLISREEILELFGGMDNLLDLHTKSLVVLKE